MKEINKKFPLSVFEILMLIIVAPTIFYFAGKLLWEPINSYAPSWFFSFAGLLVILGIDGLWVVMMKLWRIENLRIKIYATIFILTISSVILTCWVLLNMLSDVW
jgi:hypothetical protein